MFFLDAFHWSQLLQPQFYIEHGGLWLILFVVFAETGLFAGFFLPGDSLLFVAGIYSGPLAAEIFASNNEWLNLFIGKCPNTFTKRLVFFWQSEELIHSQNPTSLLFLRRVCADTRCTALNLAPNSYRHALLHVHLPGSIG